MGGRRLVDGFGFSASDSPFCFCGNGDAFRFCTTLVERRLSGFLKEIANAALLPLRLAASHKMLNRLGLRSMRDERIRAALPHCRGRLLDIGCGEGNELVRSYEGAGVGVDVYPWPGVDLICDTESLPFPDRSFDTLTILAALNHIPNRLEVLRECRRVLVPSGLLLVTMIGPLLGKVRHRLAWWDSDQTERKHAAGELLGMDEKAVGALMDQAGFRVMRRARFVCGLNSLYIASAM